jgi:hypothetical protein
MPLYCSVHDALILHFVINLIEHLRSPHVAGVDAGPEGVHLGRFPTYLRGVCLAASVVEARERNLVADVVLVVRCP